MSLLPNQIPPPTARLGTTTDQAGNVVGTVTIDTNWWLFLLNVSKQILSAPATPIPITPGSAITIMDTEDIASTDAIQDARRIANAMILEGQDIELARFDAAGLPLRIANAQLLQPDPDVTPSLRDVVNALTVASDDLLSDSAARDLANAIVLSSDGLLQDPAPQAQPTITVTVSGSPFTYTAPANGLVSITGGTVSLISIIRQTVTVATGITSGLVPVRRGDQVQISQSGVPTMIFLPN